MRRLISLLLFLTVILGGLWIGGESLIARELRKLTQADLGFSAASVTPLRQINAVGVALKDASVQGPFGALNVPTSRLWVSPLSPLRVQLDLPDRAALDLGDGPLPLDLTTPRVNARFLAMSEFVPGNVHLSSGPLRLDGVPLAQAVSVDAQLARLGGGAPRRAATGYDVNWRIDGLDPAALPQLQRAAQAFNVAGPVTFNGQGRLWLDTPATPGTIAQGLPRLAGVQINQADLRMDGMSARVIGRLEADAQGRASGALAIYSRDATPMLKVASNAGLIPERALKLANAMIRSISAMPMPDQDPQSPAAAGGLVYPTPQDGELRLPILFADGRMSLGPIPLGPAPQLLP